MKQDNVEIIQINISGADKPGLTSSLTEILARHEAFILDIGQANIHRSLTLGILFMTTPSKSGQIMKELLFKASEMNIAIRFTPITAEEYGNWVAAQGKNRYIITLVGRMITAEHLAKATKATLFKKRRKTMKKVISILLTVFTLSTFAFSIESGLYKGSSNTVSDDSASYMDVLGWQNLYFENLYAFTSIDSTKSVNIAAANNFLDGVLAYSYSGNLWGEDVVDEYALFYGFDKFGVLFNLETNSVDNGMIQQIGVNNYSFLSPSLKFGMNINDAFAFTAGFKLAHEGGKITNDAMKYTVYQNIPEVQLAGYYTFMNTSKVYASANISYDGRFGSTKASTTVGDTTTTTKSTENQNTIALGLSAEVRLADRFIYGLDATLPSITFISGKNFDGDAIPNQSQVSFEVRNGFVATLIPDRLLVSMGMTTTLPSITYIEKQDSVLGSLYNSYDFALGLYLSPAVRIDGSCSISPVDGISLEEIWNSEMNLTVSVNF